MTTSDHQTERPADLIDMSEAERASERSRPTIRRWIAAGELRRFEGTPPARGGSAPALVSRAELLALLVSKGQPPRSPGEQVIDPPRLPLAAEVEPSTPGGDHLVVGAAEVETLRAEVAKLQTGQQLAAALAEVERLKAAASAAVEIEQLRGQLAEVRAQLAGRDREIADARQQLAGMKLERDDWKDRHDATSAELSALRSSAGLAWWRRLLSG